MNPKHQAALSDVLDQLVKDHLELTYALNDFYLTLKQTDESQERDEAAWKRIVDILRERIIALISRLDEHLKTEDEKLLPFMEGDDDTVPSVRFSSLLMEQYVHSAHHYFRMFIEETETAEPMTKSKLKKATSYVREGLILLAEYFKVEKQFVLHQAERMLKD